MIPRLAFFLASLVVIVASPAQAQEQISLKPGDSIKIDVFDEPLVSRTFVINTEGSINYPLLGKLRITGKTPDGVAASVEELLEKDYIRDARVSATVTGRPSLSVRVIGQVGQPGEISFAAGTKMDLFTAIASAGGLKPTADKKKIEIRDHDGTSITVNLDSARKHPLLDGTSVVVPALPVVEKAIETVTVLGQVRKPGIIEIPPNRQLDLMTAISMAGGFTDKARPSKVIVTRNDKPIKLNASRMRKGLDKRFYLKDGDSIFVSESFF